MSKGGYAIFSSMLSVRLPGQLFASDMGESKGVLFKVFFLLLAKGFLGGCVAMGVGSKPIVILPIVFFLALGVEVPVLGRVMGLPRSLAESVSVLYFLCLVDILLVF